MPCCHQPARRLPLPIWNGSRQPGSSAGKGSGSRHQAKEGGTQQGWGHAEPNHPPQRSGSPGQGVHGSVIRRLRGIVAQPAHRPDVPAVQQTKQTTITALGFPSFGSLWFNFGNLALGLLLGENPLPAQAERQPPALGDGALVLFVKGLGTMGLLKAIKLTAKVTAKPRSL